MTPIKLVTLFISSIFFFISCSNDQNSKYIAVNKDVAKKFSNQEIILSEVDDFILLDGSKISNTEILELSHIAHDQRRCGGFTQIENGDLEAVLKNLKDQSLKTFNLDNKNTIKPQFKESIANLLNALSAEELKDKILFLQNQGTRSATSNSANVPINRFYDEIRSVLSSSKLDYILEKVTHRRTKQNSIRVRIKGSKTPQNVVVLGGHIDSTSRSPSGDAPGADDNASGSAAVFEVLRVLSDSDFAPNNTIEFIWYAGEERGLIGSNEIAREYKAKGTNVVAVMQLDMILYPGNGDVIGLVTDYVDPNLTLFTEHLVGLYLKIPVLRFRCGYGCSDHASWYQNGFAAVSPTEAELYNRNLHTSRDVFDDKSDIEHALKFTKLALAFVFEKGEFTRK